MKLRHFILTVIPFILIGCSANVSDRERVDQYFEKLSSELAKQVDQEAASYSEGIITQYYPEPYFNPTQPIPHYYAERLELAGIPYPQDKVYQHSDYEFYKERSQYNLENLHGVEDTTPHSH